MSKDSENIDYRIEKIETLFSSGNLPSRYTRHIDSVRRFLVDLKDLNEQAQSIRFGAKAIETLKQLEKAAFVLADILESKTQSQFKTEEAILESVGTEYYRLVNSPEIHGSLICSSKVINPALTRFPILVKESGGEITHEMDRLPFVLVSEKLLENPFTWLILLHEFTHIMAGNKSNGLIDADRTGQHATEYFCDLLPSDVTGPGYFLAFDAATEMLSGEEQEESASHPSYYTRASAVFQHVKKCLTPLNKRDVIVTVVNNVWQNFERNFTGKKEIAGKSLKLAEETLEKFCYQKRVNHADKNGLVKKLNVSTGGNYKNSSPIVILSSLSLRQRKVQKITKNEMTAALKCMENWAVKQL